jgi:hypothetical protein
VENFGWNFFALDYSEPAGMVLSSAAMVTAAEKVQRAGLRRWKVKAKAEKKNLEPRRARSITTEFVQRFFLRATSCPSW